MRRIREYTSIVEQVPANTALLHYWISKEVVNSPLCLCRRENSLDLIPQYNSDSADLYSVIRGEHSLDGIASCVGESCKFTCCDFIREDRGFCAHVSTSVGRCRSIPSMNKPVQDIGLKGRLRGKELRGVGI